MKRCNSFVRRTVNRVSRKVALFAILSVTIACPLIVFLTWHSDPTTTSAAMITTTNTVVYTVDPELDEAVEPFDLFIYSSYYYPTSQSLGNSSVALVITGHYNMFNKYSTLELLAWNDTDNKIVNAPIERITPHNVCGWISMFVTTPLLPNMTSLAISQGNKYVEIPFTIPSSKKRDVVTCISPLFANEQWQYLLLAAHTYKKYGSHMHLYIRSMVDPVYKLMEQYEKEDYLTIQPWLRIELGYRPEFNPNINVEFRNQAAAQTDCLLQYKESAKFISFMDLDDILIPRVGHNYLDEFENIFALLPNIAFAHYSKENVKIKAHKNPEDFSLNQMFSSIVFQQVSETGKMVTRPGTFNCTWIHWPSTVPNGMVRYDVPKEVNAITHLKTMDDETAKASKDIHPPLYNPNGKVENGSALLMSRNKIKSMQRDFERMLSTVDISSIWLDQPTDWFYYNIILECFNRTFYQFHYSGRQSKCPGPDRCDFPENPNINCSNAVADFQSSLDGEKLNVHYWTKSGFVVNDGCIK